MEFSTLEEQIAHYKAVRARLNTVKTKPIVNIKRPVIEPAPVLNTEQKNPVDNLPKKIQWVNPNIVPTAQTFLSVDRIKEMYKCVYDSASKKTYKHLIQQICEEYNIPTTLLWSNTRNKEIVRIRQKLWYLAKTELPWMSYPQIARASGRGYDHTTVLHGVKAYKRMIKNNGETV